MARIRKKEFESFGTAPVATELAVPYTRVYNAVTASGLKKISNEEELRRVVINLQQGAVPFAGLCKVFGPGMTLGSLLQYEEAYGFKPEAGPIEEPGFADAASST